MKQTLAYLELTDEELGEPGNLGRCILMLDVPRDSATAKLYARVRKWLLEVDASAFRVLREVALDGQDRPLAAAPVMSRASRWRNAFWAIDPSRHRHVTENEFNRKWQEAVAAQVAAPSLETIRRPVLHAEELFGLWSNGVGFTGSMSDESIAFFPEKRGFFEATNVGLMLYETFEWTFTEGSGLSIVASTRYDNDYGKIAATPGSLTRIQNRPVWTEQTGDFALVLVLDLQDAGYDWVAEQFVKCPRALAEIVWPSFDS